VCVCARAHESLWMYRAFLNDGEADVSVCATNKLEKKKNSQRRQAMSKKREGLLWWCSTERTKREV
jgi:hypothetical protein